jgi:hypothetical protein
LHLFSGFEWRTNFKTLLIILDGSKERVGKIIFVVRIYCKGCSEENNNEFKTKICKKIPNQFAHLNIISLLHL